jgi:hypothetical protein
MAYGGTATGLASVAAWVVDLRPLAGRRSSGRTRLDIATVRSLAFLAVSVGGYAIAATVAIGFLRAGSLVDPRASDVGSVFVAAGHAFRNGAAVYSYSAEPFFYAPPIVLACALFSYLPYPVCYALIVGANIAALRYLAGSWQAIGYTFLFIPLAFLPWAGTLDLPMAAVFVLAIRKGHVALPVFLGFMKFSPLLAIDPGLWRRSALMIGLGVLATLPAVWLWQEWFAQMGRAFGQPFGPLIPIPFLLRLPVGLALVATRRPVLRAAGAVILTPALYWHSLSLLLAPIALMRPSAVRLGAVEPAGPSLTDLIGEQLRSQLGFIGLARKPLGGSS